MLFRKDMDPRCAYCAKGSSIGEAKEAEQFFDFNNKQKNKKKKNHKNTFKYDPLKRVPPRPMKLDTDKLREEDFQL